MLGTLSVTKRREKSTTNTAKKVSKKAVVPEGEVDSSSRCLACKDLEHKLAQRR